MNTLLTFVPLVVVGRVGDGEESPQAAWKTELS